ncbi:MAG: 30S ribosomal protein S17 [Gammaproteobacteria bacterium]|nr:MAG: 30S ribosomal protein S17 [Gammaproteobacteria bacterium]
MSEAGNATQAEKKLRTVTGRVVSDKMDQTISVAIARVVKHPLYGKYLRRTTKILVHDEENTCKPGDLITIAECRPYSKRKSWRLVEVLERAEAR